MNFTHGLTLLTKPVVGSDEKPSLLVKTDFPAIGVVLRVHTCTLCTQPLVRR
jgi:hypothetical protein